MRALLLTLAFLALAVPAAELSASAAVAAASARQNSPDLPFSSVPVALEQQRQALTVEGYRDLLRSALVDLDRRGAQVAPQLAGRLRSVQSVTLPDGTLLTPDLGAATSALQSDPPDIQAARANLQAVVDELDRSLAENAVGVPSDAAARLNRVLARPEFQPETENPITRFLSDLLKPLEKPVGDFLGMIGRWIEGVLGGAGSLFDWRPVLAAFGLLLLGGLFLWVGLRLRETMGRAPARVLAQRGARGESSEDLRAEGLRLAQEGDFRHAVRALYLAALLSWQEQGVLRFDRALTNREVLAKARQEGDSGLAELLALLVDRIDRVWYGGAPCSQADYEAFAGLAARAWEAA